MHTLDEAHPLGQDVVCLGHDHHLAAVQRDSYVCLPAHVEHGCAQTNI